MIAKTTTHGDLWEVITMLENLRAEMTRYGVSVDDLHKVINKTVRATREKVAGRSPFTIQEAQAIRNAFFVGMSLEYLFLYTDSPTNRDST